MLEQDVPVYKALEIMAQESPDENWQAALQAVAEHITSGATLRSALEQHRKLFDSFVTTLIHTGERFGELQRILDELEDYIAHERSLIEVQQRAKVTPYPYAHLSLLLRRLALLLKNDVPILQSLDVCADTERHDALREAIIFIRQSVREGSSISEAMCEHPSLFPLIITEVIAASEHRGELLQACMELADYLERIATGRLPAPKRTTKKRRGEESPHDARESHSTAPTASTSKAMRDEIGKRVRKALLSKLPTKFKIQSSVAATKVNELLMKALQMGATEIHFEPRRGQLQVRYRIGNELQLVEAISPQQHARAILQRIRFAAGMAPAGSALPQEGFLKFVFYKHRCTFRVASFPFVHGDGLIVRPIAREKLPNDLTELGMIPQQAEACLEALKRRGSIIIVASPRGHGRTRTVYTMMMQFDPDKLVLMAIEDHMERNLTGIFQRVVKSDNAKAIATAVREVIAQNPDVLMVSDVWDERVMQAIVDAANAGWLVLTTMPAKSAARALERALQFAPQLADCIRLVTAQWLVRKLCQNCRVNDFTPPDVVLEALGIKDVDAKSVQFYRGQGCQECNGTGFDGYTAMFEVMPTNYSAMRELLHNKPSAEKLHECAVQYGMTPLNRIAFTMLRNGITTPAEVLRNISLPHSLY